MSVKRLVRAIFLGIAYIPLGVVLAAGAVIALALLLGAPLMVLIMFWDASWYAVTAGDARALIFPLLCALPIVMGGLLGWLTGAGWPGAFWFEDEDEPAIVWDATTGSYVPSAPGFGLLWFSPIVTFFLGLIAYFMLVESFGLPNPEGGSPYFVAASLIVAALVAKIVEAIARRRTAFRG